MFGSHQLFRCSLPFRFEAAVYTAVYWTATNFHQFIADLELPSCKYSNLKLVPSPYSTFD